MRTGWLPILALIAFPAAAQSDPYQWAGVTSVAFTGDGNGLGFIGMTTQCRADFGPGARMCKSEEIMDSDTLNPNAIPTQGCWVRPSWRPLAATTSGSGFTAGLDESGIHGSPSLDLTCQGWMSKSAGNTQQGLVLRNDPGFTLGGFAAMNCGQARPVACCKPTPVPAPTSSLSLPIGAGALAGLSLVKRSS